MLLKSFKHSYKDENNNLTTVQSTIKIYYDNYYTFKLELFFKYLEVKITNMSQNWCNPFYGYISPCLSKYTLILKNIQYCTKLFSLESNN